MESPRQLRPLGLLEIVDQIFRLYRTNFWLFYGLAAVVFLPLGLLQGVPLIGIFLSGGLMLFCLPPAMAALVQAASARYLDRPAALGQSYRWVLLRYLSFALTVLLLCLCFLGVLLVAAAPLLLVLWLAPNAAPWIPWVATLPLLVVSLPAALALVACFPFVVIAYVVEGRRYAAALSRAAFLLLPWGWAQVLLVGLIMFLLTYAIQSAFAIPMFIVAITSPERMMGDPTGFSPFLLLSGLLNGLTGAMTLPMTMGVYVLLYYDARVRKEGYDLQLLAQDLAASLPAPEAPAETMSAAPPLVPDPTEAPRDDVQIIE